MDLYSILRILTRQTGEQSKNLCQYFWKRNFCVNTDSGTPKAMKEFTGIYAPALVTSTEAAFRPYNNMLCDLFYGQYYPIYNTHGPNYLSVPLTLAMFLLSKILYRETANMSTKKGDVRDSGSRIGKLDAASEAGFFHKTDAARLREIQESLGEESDEEDEDEDPKPKTKEKK